MLMEMGREFKLEGAQLVVGDALVSYAGINLA